MLKNMEMKEHYWVKISNRYATLENFGWQYGHEQGLGKYQRKYKSFIHRQYALLWVAI